MLSNNVSSPCQISVRLKFLLREAILKYISVYYELPSPTLSEQMSNLKIIPPLYDLVMSTYFSYKSNERYTQSFENEIRNRYYQLIDRVSKFLPSDFPCILLDLPDSLYDEVPYSLRSQLASAVMEEFDVMQWRYSVNGFINQSHFEKYFNCSMTLPQYPIDTIPYLLTPISMYKNIPPARERSDHSSNSISLHHHTISQTIWANSLSCPYIIVLTKVLEGHSFSPCEANNLSHHVFDSAARLALHKATIDGLWNLIGADLFIIVREQWLPNKSSNGYEETRKSKQGSRLLEYFLDQSSRLHQDGSPTDGNYIFAFSYISTLTRYHTNVVSTHLFSVIGISDSPGFHD